MSNAIVPSESGIMTLEEANNRREMLARYVSENVLVKDIDYGPVPGTKKPVLKKPGAEKLATFFRLTPRFVLMDKVLDFDTGLFYFQYSCELYTRDNILVGMGNGSCNSHETKYRYRKAERICPECGEAAIIKGKAEYGGGWLCFRKRGGCGVKFPDGDERIEAQEVGRVSNPDPADQLNTIDKIAQKRALVAAVLIAVNASEFFTQDMDDFIDGDYMEVEDGDSGITAKIPMASAPAKTAPRRSARPPTQKAGNGDGSEAGSEWHTRTKVIAAVRKSTGMEVPHIINRLRKGEREKRIKWGNNDADVIAYATDPDSYSPPPADMPDAGAPEGEATQPELDKWFGPKDKPSEEAAKAAIEGA